jgi:chromate transporter
MRIRRSTASSKRTRVLGLRYLLGASILLGKIAIGDWLTAVVGLLSLIAPTHWKISNPVLIAATAVVGLIAFPILQPTWVFVK